MKYYFLIIFLINFVFTQIQNCSNMNKDFCQSLIDNDRETLKRIVNNYLETLDPKADSKVNFEKIKAWLESNPCIQKVEISNKIIQTRTPIAEFELLYHVDSKSDNFKLKINFDPMYQFYDLKKY